jgi:hypothetical protein
LSTPVFHSQSQTTTLIAMIVTVTHRNDRVGDVVPERHKHRRYPPDHEREQGLARVVGELDRAVAPGRQPAIRESDS